MPGNDYINKIDHSNTLALLIVASSFPNDPTIDPIPNVLANLRCLTTSLTNPELVGIPEENITISINESRSKIEKKLRDIADKTKHKKYTLLVYYTGHGILSSEDYQLYLATNETSKKDLEIEAVGIEDFKRYIKRSTAGRKIVILDCCHSGAIMGSMGDMSSKIQSGLNGFEGTYVMTSAAEDTPSLFPENNPEEPTFFTGKLVDVLNEGLDIDKEYSSLRDIYDQINLDFREKGLPLPQQSNFNNADQINFAINKKFVFKKPADEVAWEEALGKNYKWTFIDFKNQFPDSPFAKEAKKKIYEIEEDECWHKASDRNTVGSLYDYLDNYPEGRYFTDANERIRELRAKDEKRRQEAQLQEETLWNAALEVGSISSFEEYLSIYQFGRFSDRAKIAIRNLKEDELQRIEKQKKIDEESLWEKSKKENTLQAFKDYLNWYPSGKFTDQAQRQIDAINETEIKKVQQENEEKERDVLWDKAVRENTILSYEIFLDAYPKSIYSGKARAGIKTIREKAAQEENLWKKVENSNLKSAFEKYLEIYPSGKFSQEAKNQISILEKKEQEEKERLKLWHDTTEKNTIPAYEEFLKIFQQGRFTDEAKSNIEFLTEKARQQIEREKILEEEKIWEKVKKENTIESFKVYLDNYPSGNFKNEAISQTALLNKVSQEKIKKEKEEAERHRLWVQALDKDNVGFYQQFLKRYPEGEFSEVAKNNIALLNEKEAYEKEQKQHEETNLFELKDGKQKNEQGINDDKDYLTLTRLEKSKNKWKFGSVVSIALMAIVVIVLLSTKKDPGLPTPDLALQARVDIVNAIYNNFVKVPGGTFTMGVNNGDIESPAHPATVNSCFFSKYEVTRGQWNAIMSDGKWKDSLDLPATNISWIQAYDFINKLNSLSGKKYRLPTESEWEHACISGYGEKYKGKENDYSWNSSNSNGTLHPVGGGLPDSFGIYDMLGNAYEWCNDTYSEYNRKPSDNDMKVLRGGNYKLGPEYSSPKIRNMEKGTTTGDGIGFRLAMD